MTRDDVLREIAAQVLDPAELLAAFHGQPIPDVDRQPCGVFYGATSWQLADGMLNLTAWRGVSEYIRLEELHDLAAAAGTPLAAARLAAAIADHDRAHKDAARFIRKHSQDGSDCIVGTAAMASAEWAELYRRMTELGNARAAWWIGTPAQVVHPGEQLDLFAEVAG